MSKPKSQNKERDSASFKENDLSSSGEKKEIKQESLNINEPVAATSIKSSKNKSNSFFVIVLSGLATASFGLGTAFFINNYYPNFFKNKSQIVFEQNMQVRMKELSASIQKLEMDLVEANKKSEDFIAERELAANLSQLENKIIKNKEEFDLKSLELEKLKIQLETKFANIDSLGSGTQSTLPEPLQKKYDEDASSAEILDMSQDNSENRINADRSVQEDLQVIQNSTVYGNPFNENLKNIEALLDLKAPDILRNLAEIGIPTMKNLKASFPKFARLALSADRNLNETADFKILTFLKSQFQARSTIPRPGADTDAILSRSEALLKSNDLENALFELTQLDDIALKAMEPWRMSVESRIESLLAVEQLVQSIEK